MVTFLGLNGYTADFSRKETVTFILDITSSNGNFDVLKHNVSNYLQNSTNRNI